MNITLTSKKTMAPALSNCTSHTQCGLHIEVIFMELCILCTWFLFLIFLAQTVRFLLLHLSINFIFHWIWRQQSHGHKHTSRVVTRFNLSWHPVNKPKSEHKLQFKLLECERVFRSGNWRCTVCTVQCYATSEQLIPSTRLLTYLLRGPTALTGRR
jgi:hypothetical protein